jgi:hypothetical protein
VVDRTRPDRAPSEPPGKAVGAPGWYPDPNEHGLRWWRGWAWSKEAVSALPPLSKIDQQLAGWNPFRPPYLGPNDLTLELAVGLGDPGAALLARELGKRTNYMERLHIALALGDCSGTFGNDQLRSLSLTTGPGSQDIKHVSLEALAKRCGAEATPDLVRGLEDRNPNVKRTSMECLVVVGDSRAWDSVYEQFEKWLKRNSWDIVPALCYLAQHAKEDQVDTLIAAVKAKWDRLDPAVHDDLRELWPGIDQPNHSVPPDPALTRRWFMEKHRRFWWLA